MTQKRSQSDPTPLWQLAEQKSHDGLQTPEAPLAAEFNTLSEFMSKHPRLIEHGEISGDKVELTPRARYLSLAKAPKSTLIPQTPGTEPYSITVLAEDNTDIPGSQFAQAYRIEGSRELYLTISSSNMNEFRQFTIHDGHATDVSKSDKELNESETTMVKTALAAIAEKIHTDAEEIEQQRISRKIGAWWADREHRKELRRINSDNSPF